MYEEKYKDTVDRFLTEKIPVQEFTNEYFDLWRSDRDHGNFPKLDEKFQRL